MKTLKVDKNGDLVFDKHKELEMVEGGDEICQSIERTLTTRMGEWFLNVNFGLDHEHLVNVKRLNLDMARSAIYEAIMQEPRVSEVIDIILDPDYQRRVMKITFKARADDGTTVEGEVMLDA